MARNVGKLFFSKKYGFNDSENSEKFEYFKNSFLKNICKCKSFHRLRSKFCFLSVLKATIKLLSINTYTVKFLETNNTF